MFLLGSDKHRDEKPGSHVHHDVWNPAGELWSVASFLGQSDLFSSKNSECILAVATVAQTLTSVQLG